LALIFFDGNGLFTSQPFASALVCPRQTLLQPVFAELPLSARPPFFQMAVTKGYFK